VADTAIDRARPSGTVTFLFTDIVRSTRLWDIAPGAMRDALERHDAIVRDAVEKHEGVVFATGGDGFAAAFHRAVDAAAAALTAQDALAAEPWSADARVRVRMALHTGEVVERDGDYFGSAVNRTARLMGLANGGQVLCSQATSGLLADGELRLRELGLHRLRDLSRSEHVWQVNGGAFPPLRTLDTFPGNLPRELSSFIGRTEDIARVAAALDDAPLVTLTGVGGVGKTRLAVQVAAEVLPRFADGAWLCELGNVGTPEALTQTVAGTLAVAPRDDLSLVESIVERLEGRQALVLLDNCEHLLDAAAEVVSAIARGCPGVRVLATSREALALDGEQVFPIRPLQVAAQDEDGTPCDAVALFAERAASIEPSFSLEGSNGAAVTEVCKRLDGIPLAIELAASRIGAVSPAEILGLLDERFRLLTGGRRARIDRHATLRATVDWSYSLLSATEQRVFDRLSVFAGAFTAETAQIVVTGDGVEPWDVLDALGHLVGSSMVVADAHPAGTTRCRLLETMRYYARERLEQEGTSDQWRRRHAQCFADLAEAIGEGLTTADEISWRARLDAQVDDFREAILWGLDSPSPNDVARAVSTAAAPIHQTTSPKTEVGRWCQLALPASAGAPDVVRRGLLGGAAMRAFVAGSLEEAERLSHEAQALIGPEIDHWNGYLSVLTASLVHAARGELSKAVEVLDAAGAIEVAYPWVRASFLAVRGIWLFHAGDMDTCRAVATEGLDLARLVGHPSTLEAACYAFGLAQLSQDQDMALEAFEQSFALAMGGTVGSAGNQAMAFATELHLDRGDMAAAADCLRMAMHFTPENDRMSTTNLVIRAVRLLAATGQHTTAATAIGAVTDGPLQGFASTLLAGEYGEQFDRAVDAVRSAIGYPAFESAAARGRRMVHGEVLLTIADAVDQLGDQPADQS
jgi:predicted ATPase/class 3 adenylate cyclase